MSQKLEERLLLYERDHPIRNDQELIAAIQYILSEQDSLPIKKKDFDLIAEATETVLKLQGYSEEQLTEMADEAVSSLKARLSSQQDTPSAKPKTRRRVLRWLIPVAVILVLTTVAVFASSTNRLAISEMTRHIFDSLTPKTVYHEDNIDLVVTNDIQTYVSFEELSAAYDSLLLLPFELENKIQNLSILVSDFGESKDIDIVFDYRDFLCGITITPSEQIAESTTIGTTTVGEYSVVLQDFGDYTSAHWTYNQYYYQVNAKNTDDIKSIISQMRSQQ